MPTEDELKAVTKQEGDGAHPASHYLVVEDPASPSTWHLRVRGTDGKPDHGLMGAAWAALHGGYRCNTYEGPGKQEALAKLKRLYAEEGMDTPAESKATVKAVGSDDGEWVLDVLGCPYGGPQGGKDLQGEYFSPATKWHEDRFALPPVLYYHGWTPDGHPSSEPEFIGKTVSRRVDADGVWYRVVLDKVQVAAKRIWDAAKQGLARASSGAVAHLVRKAGDGHLLHWPVAELSLIDVGDGRAPANSYAIALPAMKAVYERAGINLPDMPESEADAEGLEPEATAATVAAKGEAAGAKAKQTKGNIMDEETKAIVGQAVAEALKAQREADEAAAATRAAKDAEIKAAQDAAVAEYQRTEAAKARRLPGGMPYVTQFNDQRYDGLDVRDMGFLVNTLDHTHKGSKLVDRELAYKSLAMKMAEAEGKGDNAAHAGMKAIGLKANELERSTLSSYGDEWAGVLYSTQLWERIRFPGGIVALIPEVTVPQGAESIVIPLEGTDPKFYVMAQASDLATTTAYAPIATVLSSQVGTPTPKTLTPKKLGARVLWSGEMEEDSMVPWVTRLRTQMDDAASATLEHIVIDGDTETGATTNINDIAGTPAVTDPFMLFNGLRKLCLITNTANKRDGTTLAIEDYLETLKLLGAGGKNVASGNTMFVVDPWTMYKTMDLSQLLTRDVAGQPTLENGILTSIWGKRIYVSGNMCNAGDILGTVTTDAYKMLSNAAGKVDQDTEANNTKGSILAFRTDQWLIGWKRRVQTETQRHISSDSTEIVVTLRVDMTYRDIEASAISYDLTV